MFPWHNNRISKEGKLARENGANPVALTEEVDIWDLWRVLKENVPHGTPRRSLRHEQIQVSKFHVA